MKGDKDVIARFAVLPAKFRMTVRQALEASGRAVQGTARSDYLSGPRPQKLDRVSGDLAKSLYLSPVIERLGVLELLVKTKSEYGAEWEKTSRAFLKPALWDKSMTIRENLRNAASEALRSV